MATPVTKQVQDHFVNVIAALNVVVSETRTLTLSETGQVITDWSPCWQSPYDHRVIVDLNSEDPEHHTRNELKDEIGLIIEVQCKPGSNASLDRTFLVAWIQDAIYANKRLTNVIDTTRVDGVEHDKTLESDAVYFVAHIAITATVHHLDTLHKGE